MKEEKIKQFESDYADFINASIAYAELQETYRPLVFEEEVEWIQNWMRKNL